MSYPAGIGMLMALLVSSTLSNVVDANAFLKAHASTREEHISEEDVQTSLLAEVEGTFGPGAASSRVKQLEKALGPIYAALPKNEKGYLGHATVRYALHRLFVQRHGWIIKGLDTAGAHRNSTSNAGLLKEQVPSYIQDLFEARLGGRGFGLHELGVLAATIEHLVHSEAIKRLGDAFKVHKILPTSSMSQDEASDVLDTYMTAYILGEDLSNVTLPDVIDFKAEMPDIYMAWNETRDFVRAVQTNVAKSDGNAEQQSSGKLDFSLVARVAERIGEQFGTFQDQECRQLKATLLNISEPGTGRVRLSDFYKPAVGGLWHFQESVAYLRQLGALDESDLKKPRVVIPNYLSSPSNCIASSSFYSVCCMDECEGLLGHLEREIAAPQGTSTRIAELVSHLPSSSVAAPRKMPEVLLDRLGEIAAQHEGTIPLHGRLFAQWMHHAFPSECPYPHLSGTTNPQTPDEWLASTGEDSTATHAEIKACEEHDQVSSEEQDQVASASLPWHPEEELLVAWPSQQKTDASGMLRGIMRNLMMFAALASTVYAMACGSLGAPTMKGGTKAEKYMV